jgi:hypothetical protein
VRTAAPAIQPLENLMMKKLSYAADSPVVDNLNIETTEPRDPALLQCI